MQCADFAALTFASWQIRLCLLGMFISPEATVVAVKTAQAFLSRVNNDANLISFFASIFHSWRKYFNVQKAAQIKSRMLNCLLCCFTQRARGNLAKICIISTATSQPSIVTHTVSSSFCSHCVFFCKFISAEAAVINLFALLRVFLVGLGNWKEIL